MTHYIYEAYKRDVYFDLPFFKRMLYANNLLAKNII